MTALSAIVAPRCPRWDRRLCLGFKWGVSGGWLWWMRMCARLVKEAVHQCSAWTVSFKADMVSFIVFLDVLSCSHCCFLRRAYYNERVVLPYPLSVYIFVTGFASFSITYLFLRDRRLWGPSQLTQVVSLKQLGRGRSAEESPLALGSTSSSSIGHPLILTGVL